MQDWVFEGFSRNRTADVAATREACMNARLEIRCSRKFNVLLHGETLAIPVRVYSETPALFALLTADTRNCAILACIGSRHHDGFVREHCVDKLLLSGADDAIPYIYQLLGEYVAPISSKIATQLKAHQLQQLKSFVTENPEYAEKTRQRARSYWDAYYRSEFPDVALFPSLVALARIDEA